MSAGRSYEETNVKIQGLFSFFFSTFLYFARLTAGMLSAVDTESNCTKTFKKKTEKTQQRDRSNENVSLNVSVHVSLISFSQHSEDQSEPPCVNSAGALAPADDFTKRFNQSLTLTASVEGDMKNHHWQKKY